MSDVPVRLLVFAGCPLAAAARQALEQALGEIDLLAPETAEELRGWGSPTILIDGEDVAGQPKGNEIGCRVYPGPTKVPSVATIVARPKAAARPAS